MGPIEPDLEITEQYLFQLDRVRGHGEFVGLGVDFDLVELVSQGQ